MFRLTHLDYALLVKYSINFKTTLVFLISVSAIVSISAQLVSPAHLAQLFPMGTAFLQQAEWLTAKHSIVKNNSALFALRGTSSVVFQAYAS